MRILATSREPLGITGEALWHVKPQAVPEDASPGAAEIESSPAIRLLRDVGIPERFVDVTQDSYSKNRLGQGPTKFYENAKVIKGDAADVDRITNHVLGDACTPGNAKECTFETVRPVVEHSMTGDLDDLLS